MIKFTKNLLIQALNNSPTPALFVDARKPGQSVIYLNPAAEILLGRDATELMGVPFADILAKGSLPATTNGSDASAVQQTGFTDRHQWHTSNGLSILLDVAVSPLHDPSGRVSFWMLSVVGDAAPQGHDTAILRSELVDARRQIKGLQRTDPVTGLANRGTFDEVMERDWSIARREQRRITVIVFSIDCLDEYREIFGRHATDSLLQKVGHAIGGTLQRAGDLAARIDNDRFAVLIGDPDGSQAESFGNLIAAKVRNLAIHHPRSTTARFATVSYGMASEVPAWTKKSVTLLDEAGQQIKTGRQSAEDQQAGASSRTGNEETVS